jgi:hypothetical protein
MPATPATLEAEVGASRSKTSQAKWQGRDKACGKINEWTIFVLVLFFKQSSSTLNTYSLDYLYHKG